MPSNDTVTANLVISDNLPDRIRDSFFRSSSEVFPFTYETSTYECRRTTKSNPARSMGSLPNLADEMKIYDDDNHRSPPKIEKGDFVYMKLVKKGNPTYHLDS